MIPRATCDIAPVSKQTRLLVPLALLSLFALAGCGGGSSAAAAGGDGSSASTTAAGSTSGVPAEMQAYVDCLKKNGVDLPANGRFFGPGGGQGAAGDAPTGQAPPSFQSGEARQTQGGQVQTQAGNGGAPPSFDREKFQVAQQACASLLPKGATFGNGFPGRGAGGGIDNSAFNAYRSCMSDHGVTLPARQNGQNGQSTSTSTAPVSIDRNSDAFKAANGVCAPLLPNGGQGFGGQPGQGANTSTPTNSTQGTNP